MEAERVSHYDILERLGGGGMGVVYKALDTKLNRHVALKFLPHELTRDDEARVRFVQEAQAASALDHPNICTIYEIDSTPEGQMFIAMSFYDGETLKKRIDNGPLPVDEALDIASQIALGLSKAHAAGIVHRDIKPANVMVTRDGFVKILDFGIAKLLGVTGPTQAGSTLGTVSYMSPEQVAGEDADPRSDVWALGALFYELLTGRLPFRGENQWAVMNAIANHDPQGPRSLRPEVPEDVEHVVMEALEKDRGERTPSAEAFQRHLEGCRAAPAGAGTAPALSTWQAFLRPTVAVPVMVVVLGLGAWSVMSASQGADERWAREEALPQMLAFLDEDAYAEAFALGEEIEDVIPNDPLLADALGAAAVTGDVVTDPPGADVYVRPYSDPDAEWRLLGRSPIQEARLPRSAAVQIRVEMAGYEPAVLASGVPGFYFGRSPAEMIRLQELGTVPPEMVYVPAGDFPVRINGFNTGDPVHLEPFLIDRHEVTNAEYKEFVDAGGYQNSEYWEGLDFVLDGRSLSFGDAMARFLDATDQPGPETWEFSDFLEGEADYPVRGVSWYEAVAYNRFRDKDLPTLYHWARAAFEPHAIATPLSSAMLPFANFGDGPVAVGSTNAMGPQGTLDMAGNVKEWVWTASGDHHWLLGGAWDDDPYMSSTRFTSPPFDRSSRHGFRGVRYLGDGVSDDLLEPVDLLSIDYRNAEPVSDDVYEYFRTQLAYVPAALNADVESVDESHPDWIWEHVALDAGYADERVNLYLFLPKTVEPPYQPLIFFPGVGAFRSPSNQPSQEAMRVPPPTSSPLDGMIRSGRALVVPIWKGSYERWDDFLAPAGEEYLRRMRSRMTEWVGDLGRTIDYLETREDLRADLATYVGVSFGASTALPLIALEERLRAAVLLLPGYTYREMPPEAYAVNHMPRVSIPVLMIGGEYDYVFPVETSSRPLYEQIGSEDKQFHLYEMGHGPFPRGQTLRDLLPWLDERLGPVD